MGSVSYLYTTGDNDPEIEPVQYYRHYMYCDACGSFEVEPWADREPEVVENIRHNYAVVAFLVSPLVVVGLWASLGFVLSPITLVALAAGMVIAPVLRGWVSSESAATRWRFVKWSLVAIPLLWVAEELVDGGMAPWLMLVGGGLLLVALLVARALVEMNVQYRGVRCRSCNATYANGTPFFTDLKANPRQLTVADVPRPLGSSYFIRGASVEEGRTP